MSLALPECWQEPIRLQSDYGMYFCHDFCIECVTRLIVNMARSIKVDELSTSKALSSVALQVGYRQLEHKQNKAVKEFASGRDLFVSLPTGSGASLYAMLCYLLLSMLRLPCILLFRQMV